MKPSYWGAKCRPVSNCCIAALWLYSKDYRAFTRRFRVTENAVDRPGSGRSRVTTAANDCYIVLQHLHNSPLNEAAAIWYSSIGCKKSVETLRSTYSCVPTYFGQILTRRH